VHPSLVTDTRACPHCGAHVARLDARFCEFCGTELPLSDAAAASVSPVDQLQRRFSTLDAHADLHDLMEHMPQLPSMGVRTLFPAVFLVVFILVALGMLAPFAQAPMPFALAPLVFVAFGIFGLGTLISRATRYRQAPVRRKQALVADERVAVHGGGRNSSASTNYFLTLEYPDGSREEVRTSDDMTGRLAPGDMGVAYLKDRYLVEFRRVPV